MKSCGCGASDFNACPESCAEPGMCAAPAARTDGSKKKAPKWSEEELNWVKTRLQEIRGAALTDKTMSITEARQLETLLESTPNVVLFVRSFLSKFITL